MTRVVRGADRVVVDRRQTLPGRGAYVHASTVCIEAAVKRGGLARALRCQIPARLTEELGAK